ncbi:hypothetical protein [Brevundimonas sp.]|jgi:hypothetical protein|uniref:hypothetical protein n=1 Tax=Brevundimonas sp. TaxID=1871086 RepID=UPI0037BE8DC0
MDKAALTGALAPLVTTPLASKLVDQFVQIRIDFATKTLGRASPGKFVETFVQCLQHMATGTFEAKPDIDRYLNLKLENEASLPESIRVCGGRIARSIYTLRNKRNIAHDNEVDPNTFDLAFIQQASAWIMAELFRTASGLSMQEAGNLVAIVQAPVNTLVEEIGDTRLVLPDVSARAELLLLLHSHYPELVTVPDALRSLSRRSAKTVRNRLRDLHDEKLAHGSAKDGYRLTTAGHSAAMREVSALKA